MAYQSSGHSALLRFISRWRVPHQVKLMSSAAAAETYMVQLLMGPEYLRFMAIVASNLWLMGFLYYKILVSFSYSWKANKVQEAFYSYVGYNKHHYYIPFYGNSL